MDGPPTEVFGNLGSGIIGAKGLLVDVLLEDVPQHVRVNFIVVAAGRVIEVPGIALEEIENVLEGLVGTSMSGLSCSTL